MSIQAVKGIDIISPIPKSPVQVAEAGQEESVSFKDLFNQALLKVDALQKESSEMTELFAMGETDNIHQVMITAEKADVALQFVMQVRSKILDAYNEIMRMQI